MADINSDAQIRVVQEDDRVTIEASGSIDLTNSSELRDALKAAGTEAESICVDLTNALFIDTAVLEYLARAGKAMYMRKKRLTVLARDGSHPLRVLRIASLDMIMDVQAVARTEEPE